MSCFATFPFHFVSGLTPLTKIGTIFALTRYDINCMLHSVTTTTFAKTTYSLESCIEYGYNLLQGVQRLSREFCCVKFIFSQSEDPNFDS